MHTVELEAGGQYTCTLPGKASAGYLWEHTVEGMSDVVDITEITAEPLSSERQGGVSRAGYSADVQFTITARVPGDVIIRFKLRRQWETSKPPVDERVLRVIVRSQTPRSRAK